MESRVGGEVKSCRANPILFSGANAWLFLWMGVSGMGADGIAGCRNTIANTGG